MFLMFSQSFTAPTDYTMEIVRKGYGDLAGDMPPVLLAFLSETFNGGYPLTQDGENWEMVTHLQQIRFDILEPRKMRLRSWGRHQDREAINPAIDRVLKCNKE